MAIKNLAMNFKKIIKEEQALKSQEE